MMGDDMLARACELAFEVAKEGGAPSAMKNYLYLAQRPPRAYSVAQRALDEDDAFRERVAARATIDGVGEAGYLWLQRPEGWQDRFAALRSGAAIDTSDPLAPTVPVDERPPMPTPPDIDPVASPAPAPAGEAPPSPAPAPAAEAAPSPAPAPPSAASQPAPAVESARSTEPAPTVSSIEDELTSLRSLVDRLADERQNVRSSVSELEQELETRRAENLEMSTRLSVLRKELVSVQSAESDVLSQRDRALERVSKLDAEVAALRADVDRLSAEAEGSVAEHEAALTSLAELGSQRDSLQAELSKAHAERDRAASALANVESERDAVKSELAEARTAIGQLGTELETERAERGTEKNELDAERSRLRSEVSTLEEATGGLAAERDALASELRTANEDKATAETALDEAKQALAGATERLGAMEQLHSDNEELARRLAVAEQARVDLEGQLAEVSDKWQAASRQLTVFENVNSQLDAAVTERDELRNQLDRANIALAGLRDRIGTSHDRIRGELTGIESTFDGVPAEAAASTVEEAPIELDLPTETTPALSDDASLTELADIESAPFTDDGGDLDGEDFDGAGLELDRDLLDGHTIGDMFGAEPEADVDNDIGADVVAEESDAVDTFAEVADSSALPDVADSPDEAMDSDAVSDVREIAAVDALNVPDADDITDGLEDVGDLPDVPELADVADTSEDDDDIAPAAATATASAVRARLSIGADLDGSERASAVVNARDVIVLIDGDGASTLGWPHLDVATRRSALVTYLGQLTAETGAAADVVFERPVGGEDALPVSEKVRVRIADDSVEESPIFPSIIDRYPLEWPIALVTDHESIADSADDLGVTVLSNNQLLDLFLDLNSAS